LPEHHETIPGRDNVYRLILPNLSESVFIYEIGVSRSPDYLPDTYRRYNPQTLTIPFKLTTSGHSSTVFFITCASYLSWIGVLCELMQTAKVSCPSG